MLFNSGIFLFAFLPIAYLVFWQLKTKQQRYVWLTITGYVFYSFWNYKFCALMAFSTMVSYVAGLGFLKWKDPHRRRLCLVIPIAVDLLLLGFFKYANFVVESAETIAKWADSPFHAATMSIILPVGISFYTFHTITYIVDSYRGTIKPTRNFFEFTAYVSLFSQLVAGPIVRFRQIEGDLENIDHANRWGARSIGWSYFIIGMVKKVLIADTIASMINPGLHADHPIPTATAWLLTLGYTYQLYFDFSGYSDMAVGLGHLFGLRLPQNFNSPYKALNVGDFWHRWHISLSSCLRDYLYIPMGGGRGPLWKVNRNLLITMLLGGLWHGANWTFVVWGAYHGLLLLVHRMIAPSWERLPVVVQRAATFLLVMIGWVFFRSDNFGMAFGWLHSMFCWVPGSGLPWEAGLLAMLAAAGAIAHLGRNTFELRHEWNPWSSLGLAVLFTACVMQVVGGQWTPFLYFQF